MSSAAVHPVKCEVKVWWRCEGYAPEVTIRMSNAQYDHIELAAASEDSGVHAFILGSAILAARQIIGAPSGEQSEQHQTPSPPSSLDKA